MQQLSAFLSKISTQKLKKDLTNAEKVQIIDLKAKEKENVLGSVLVPSRER